MEHKGLSSQDVARLQREGKVHLVKRETSRTYGGIFLSNLFNVFNLVVFGVALVLLILYFTLGDKRTLYDAMAISTVAILNTLISIVQEIRAKRALDRIIALSRSMTTVIRDAEEQDIPTDDIVLGEVILLKRGEQIPVDGEMLESYHCEVDESLLTGESEYIFKEEGDEVLSGSFCVAGKGVMVARKVGPENYIHQLTREAGSYKRFVSPLQKNIDGLVQVLIGLACLMVLLVVGEAATSHLLKGQKLDLIETTRSVASIVTSMIPVGLILLSTVAFALGVFRISQQGALIQKLNAIESFANVDTICMDKTGTLTKNELKVHEVTPMGAMQEATSEEIVALLAVFAHGCAEKNATIEAVMAFCDEPAEGAFSVEEEVPFNSRDKYSALRFTFADAQHNLLLGAFERLSQNFSAAHIEATREALEARQGLRNLVLAQMSDEVKEEHGGLEAAVEAGGALELVGLVSLMDEVRPEIEEVLALFQEKQIKLKVISGDAAETVQAVAIAAGWKEDTSRVITGPELDELEPAQIAEYAERYSLFARVSPQNKRDLMKGLQSRDAYVAMIGDGVNDVLALKQAQLGVAMGAGNRISKDVSDIVLLNNDFAIMPRVFDEGLTIIGNIQSSSKLFLTKNMYAVFLILCSGFLGLAFPLVPRHVTIVGFFSISVPALLLTFTKRMRADISSFLRDVLRFVLISGAVIALSGLLGYFISRVLLQQKVEVARTALLTQLVLLSLLNVLLIVGHSKIAAALKERSIVLFVLGFVVLYFVLLFVLTQVQLFAPLTEFLEVYPLSRGDLLTAAILTPISMGIMILLHHLLPDADPVHS